MQTRLTDTPGSEDQARAQGLAWHTLSAEQVLQAEEVDARRGLSSAEATARADRVGPNKMAVARAEPGWRVFIRQYSDPMQIVLLVAGLLTLATFREHPQVSLYAVLSILAGVPFYYVWQGKSRFLDALR